MPAVGVVPLPEEEVPVRVRLVKLRSTEAQPVVRDPVPMVLSEFPGLVVAHAATAPHAVGTAETAKTAPIIILIVLVLTVGSPIRFRQYSPTLFVHRAYHS